MVCTRNAKAVDFTPLSYDTSMDNGIPLSINMHRDKKVYKACSTIANYDKEGQGTGQHMGFEKGD